MFNIVNQSKYLNFQANQSFYVELGDYYSWQSQEARRNEWLFRTYWQCQETISKLGYVYWDTLSYDNEHLPHIMDYLKKYNFKSYNVDTKRLEDVVLEDNFSCFSHEDYRYFLVRLRRALEYRGMDAKYCLKYFMVCEYGSDKVYRDEHGRQRKGTSRPHYHIIFFVNNPTIDAFEFSQLVSECWGKGRTDGLPYKTRSYVAAHNVIRGNNMVRDDSRVRKVCNYIAKYVNKDGDWRNLIETRLRRIFDELFGEVYINPYTKEEEHEYTTFFKDPVLKDKYEKLVREIDVFHRQSQGFGEYALEAQDDDEIRNMLNTGMMSMPSDDKGVHGKHIPIPKYYQMKIFWQQYRDKNNMLRWKPTELGSEFRLRQFHRIWKRQKMKIKDWWNNMPTYAQFNDGDMRDYNSVREQILKLLDGRTLEDVVDYRMIYKGRIRSRWSMDTGNIDDPRTMLYNRFYFDPEKLDEGDFMYNYATKPDKRYFGRRFVMDRDLGDKTRGYNYIYGTYDSSIEAYTGKDVKDTIGFMTPFVFGLVYCYNQYSNDKFRNFDDIISLMDRFDEGYKQTRQKTYESKIEYKKRLADNGFYIHTKI